MRLLLPLCCLAMALQAQDSAPAYDANTLLAEVRKKMLAALDQLPRYMCTETIDRSVSQPLSGISPCKDIERQRDRKGWRPKPHTSDRLRLDVAVSAHTEMYSWAGDNRFEDRSLAELVHSGATSTGAFSSFLSAVFQSEAIAFTYEGKTIAGGRALAEFGFHVPVDKSRYSVGDKQHHAMVGYHGTFLIDPVSLEMVHLTVMADRIPADISACTVTNTLDYGSVRLNGSDFVLPAEVRFRVVRNDGSELENRTVFSGCHQFLGESSLRFDDSSQMSPVKVLKDSAKDPGLPGNRMFTVVLAEPIRMATAAAGDPVTATLRKGIKGKDHRQLVPGGAIVRGRIVQSEVVYGKDFDTLLVALHLESIEYEGTTRPLHARLDSVVQGRRNMLHLPVQLAEETPLDETIDAAEPDAGILRFYDVSPDFVIPRGTQLTGVTLASR